MTKWKKRPLMWVFNLCNYVLLYLYYVVVGYWHWTLKWWVVIWKWINCHDCYYTSGGHFKINPNNSLRHCVPPPSYGILVTQFHFSPFCFTSLYFSLASPFSSPPYPGDEEDSYSYVCWQIFLFRLHPLMRKASWGHNVADASLRFLQWLSHIVTIRYLGDLHRILQHLEWLLVDVTILPRSHSINSMLKSLGLCFRYTVGYV